MLSPETDAYLNQILQGVVTSGTGRKAALPDRPVAGKTGTTENFGDAWFVGYTPQLVTAVWVGYPNRYVPMLHEYHGKAVAGGTFPAEIWKKFTTSALKLLDDQPQTFPAPPLLYQSPRRVVYRDGRIELDNGYCRGTSEIVYFGHAGPARRATCKKNEVEVPRVVGMTLAEAKARLAQQPLARVGRLQAGGAATARGHRDRPVPVDRRALVVGQGDARDGEAVARRRPLGRRARPARRAGAAAQGQARACGSAGSSTGSRDACSRRRRCPGWRPRPGWRSWSRSAAARSDG